MRKVVKSDEICYTVLVMIEKRTDKNSTLPHTEAHTSKANYLTQLCASQILFPSACSTRGNLSTRSETGFNAI